VSIFCEFVAEFELGSIEPVQYELTYVNHIPQGDCWESPFDLSGLFVAFNNVATKGEFLSDIEGVDWTTTHMHCELFDDTIIFRILRVIVFLSPIVQKTISLHLN